MGLIWHIRLLIVINKKNHPNGFKGPTHSSLSLPTSSISFYQVFHVHHQNLQNITTLHVFFSYLLPLQQTHAFFFFLLFLPNSYVHFYTYKFLRNQRTVFPTTPPNQTLLTLSILEHFDFVAFGTSPLGLFFHHHHRQSRHHHYNERKQM